MADTRRWALEEFGHTELGDARRTARLVALAEEVATRPAGTVLKACATSASREGAFRLLENDAVRPDALRQAVEHSTLLRCCDERLAIVSVDGSSLTLTDHADSRGLGAIGAWEKGARGVQVMTALVLKSDGSTLGIGAQKMWVRGAKSPHGRYGARGAESENSVWLDVLRDTKRGFDDVAPGCAPWFQMDRGADCWQVLELSAEHGLLVTVRAAHDRRIDDSAKLLWATLERAPAIAKRQVQVPARASVKKNKRVNGKRRSVMTQPRRARVASVAIRAAAIPIRYTTGAGEVRTVHLNAVYVRESNRLASDRLEWMLLTTHSIRTRRDVLEVVRGYALRWRIEEFHRLWKSGLCRVEDTQLRSRNAIFKWATILAAVATRAMRLTHLARSNPDDLASGEFSPAELQALIAVRKPKGVALDHVPTLAVAVRWLADIGGYTGPWNGPPGTIVIGRGLHEVLIVTRAFESRDKMR